MSVPKKMVGLIVEAEQTFARERTGIFKKQWVVNKLECTGLNEEVSSLLIDDIVHVLKSPEARELFLQSSSFCKRWCCRK